MSTAPLNLQEVINVIGEAAALKLVECFGGTSPRLPAIRNINDDHPMAQCIGVDLLTKLVTATGGGRWLYVAKCARFMRETRNREIVRLYSLHCDNDEAGMSVAELALKYQLSDRQIWNILGSTVIDDRQVSLVG